MWFKRSHSPPPLRFASAHGSNNFEICFFFFHFMLKYTRFQWQPFKTFMSLITVIAVATDELNGLLFHRAFHIFRLHSVHFIRHCSSGPFEYWLARVVNTETVCSIRLCHHHVNAAEWKVGRKKRRRISLKFLSACVKPMSVSCIICARLQLDMIMGKSMASWCWWC